MAKCVYIRIMELFLDLLKNTLLSYIVYRIVAQLHIQHIQIQDLKQMITSKVTSQSESINTCIENIEILEQNIIKVRDVLDVTREMLLNTETQNHLKSIKNFSL